MCSDTTLWWMEIIFWYCTINDLCFEQLEAFPLFYCFLWMQQHFVFHAQTGDLNWLLCVRQVLCSSCTGQSYPVIRCGMNVGIQWLHVVFQVTKRRRRRRKKKKKHHCIIISIYYQQVWTLWGRQMTLVDVQSDAEKTCQPKSSAMKIQSNWWPLNPGSFEEYTMHLISAPKSYRYSPVVLCILGLQL